MACVLAIRTLMPPDRAPRGWGQKRLDSRRPVTPRAKIFKNRFRKQVMKIWFLKSMLLNGTPGGCRKHAFCDGSPYTWHPMGRGVWIGEVWWSEQNEEDTMRVGVAVVLALAACNGREIDVETFHLLTPTRDCQPAQRSLDLGI
jgi:hypothetical protein